MPLSPELVELLACPKCHGPLSLSADGSVLACAACRLGYRIEDDIPNFIVGEASPLP